MKTRKSESKDAIRSRDFKAREQERREHEENAWEAATDKYDMNYEDSLYIPPHIIPEDKVYAWVRESYFGKTDMRRIPSLRRAGWTPVPSSRHPELMYHTHDEAGYREGFITNSGLVLYEISRMEFEKRRRKIEEENMVRLCTLPGTENFMGDPEIPSKIITNDTYATRATRAASFR